MSKNINGKTLTTFDDLWNDPKFATEDEKEQIDFQVALIGKIIEAREKKGFSQAKLAEAAGVKQPAIARLEKMKAVPQIDTLMKILRPLGYRLEIVPINHQEPQPTADNK